MMWLIKRGSKYVAKAGSENSYTADIRKARCFKSRQVALEDACENEHVVNLYDEMENARHA